MGRKIIYILQFMVADRTLFCSSHSFLTFWLFSQYLSYRKSCKIDQKLPLYATSLMISQYLYITFNSYQSIFCRTDRKHWKSVCLLIYEVVLNVLHIIMYRLRTGIGMLTSACFPSWNNVRLCIDYSTYSKKSILCSSNLGKNFCSNRMMWEHIQLQYGWTVALLLVLLFI